MMNDLFETPKHEKLSIYVTHGSVMVLSLISKQFLAKEGEIQVFLSYDTRSREYIIQTGRCSAIVKERLVQEFSLDELPQKHAFSNLDECLQFVKCLGKPIYRVCCDVNLTHAAGHVVSYEAHMLLKKSRAYQVIFIHSTPECTNDVTHYLRGGVSKVNDTVRQTQHLFQLPLSVKEGGVFDRANNFLRFIKDNKHSQRTWTEERAEIAAADIICRNIYRFFMFKKMKAIPLSNKFDMQSNCRVLGGAEFYSNSDAGIKIKEPNISQTKPVFATFGLQNSSKVHPRYLVSRDSSLNEPHDEPVENHPCCVVS